MIRKDNSAYGTYFLDHIDDQLLYLLQCLMYSRVEGDGVDDLTLYLHVIMR